MTVHIFEKKEALALAAALQAAEVIRRIVARKGHARIVVATGNSQVAMMEKLVTLPEIPWGAVEAFHLDEYVGLPATHPAAFRLWIRTRFEDKVQPRVVHYINGDATDLDAELRRYSDLLAAGPLDLAFIGIGENGHIAFNDPPVADFLDPKRIRKVPLDEVCRLQQVGEGHFANLEAVPTEAVSFTCPQLMAAETLICSVPDFRKAVAVRDSLEGPLTTACPGSLLRVHSGATLYLDAESASLLSPVWATRP